MPLILKGDLAKSSFIGFLSAWLPGVFLCRNPRAAPLNSAACWLPHHWRTGGCTFVHGPPCPPTCYSCCRPGYGASFMSVRYGNLWKTLVLFGPPGKTLSARSEIFPEEYGRAVCHETFCTLATSFDKRSYKTCGQDCTFIQEHLLPQRLLAPQVAQAHSRP
jgi:hypothetical protein